MHHVEFIARLKGQHIENLEELIAAAKAVDMHDPLGEHKFLRMQHGDDLAAAFLAYVGDRLTGYAQTLIYGTGEERRVSSEVVVHPDFRRSGIGKTLMKHVMSYASTEGARQLDIWSYNDTDASRHFAESFKLQATRRLMHMHRHPGPPPIVAEPEDAKLRHFRQGPDDEQVLAMNNRIFAGHPENGSWTLADFQARTAQPWFRPEDLLILEVDSERAGFCWVKVEERGDEGMVGEIYVIGTLPEYHGRGLGRYLLGEALRHLSGRNVNAVAVYVDQSNERAVALYWSFEFHHHHVDVLYSCALPAADSGERPTAAADSHY
jgi:mycothiol synthase